MSQGLRRIVRLYELPKWTGLGRTQNKDLIDKGELPKPFSLAEGGRAKGIFEDELIAWQRKRSSRGEGAVDPAAMPNNDIF
jgi:predicted DNA-binding transcriptional regulator AlpA